MLKHLLSSTGTEQQPDPSMQQQQYHSYPIEYKYEHTGPPPNQQQQSTTFGTNNNTICHESSGTVFRGAMNDGSLANYDSVASNTSDFLSSTFNLLTSDNTLDHSAAASEWPQYSFEPIDNKQRVFCDPNQQTYYSNTYPQYMNGSHSEEQMHPQQVHDMHQMRQADSTEPAEKRPKKGTGGPSARNCQLEYTENFKRFINIPTQPATLNNSTTPPQRSLSANNSDSGVQSPSDSEESDSNGGQTIQCPACKSVYSSPRSLTGHIGRTEKCRELIGRDYLEEIAKMGKSGCIPDPIAGEGISPVCPHCNRFISHYKGNIRRHVNSCKKTPGRKDSGASAEPTGSNSSNVSLASYDTTSTPNPSHPEDHQTQPCSSSKDQHAEYSIPPMHSHPMHHNQPPVHAAVHFVHPNERHIPQMHHQLPSYHFHQAPPTQQHQMTLVTHLPPASHQVHQSANQIHPSYRMEYMSYEPIHHQQHIQAMPAQHYEITYVRTPPENPQTQQNHPASISTNADGSITPKLPKLKHNGMVPVNDPYFCQWCTFSTVYKGNMKRHLISCHACTDELLRKYNFELERLRKSNPHPASSDCLPFIEIKPPAPPGTRRSRNPPNSKSLGRPKKANSTNSEKLGEPSQQQFEGQPPVDYLTDQQLQYGVIPPQQIKVEYQQAPVSFIATPGQMMVPNGNPGYIIKDCANDSGLSMELADYGTDALHHPQALPGY